MELRRVLFRSRPAMAGSRTLKDAVNEAMRDWVATVETSHYLLGSVMGPHPYPFMVRELHRVIGDEAREQCRELLGRDPDVVTACVGGGSNAIGLFSGFAELPDVELVEIGRAHVELQSLIRISYAVFCLKKKKHTHTTQ